MSESDLSQQIASLRQSGADLFEPVQFHYVQALSERVHTQQGAVKRILDGKLAQAVAAFELRFEQSQRDADKTIATQQGDEPRDSLAALARDLAQHKPMDARFEWSAGSRPELKSTEYFRDTWSKISAGKQVTQALGKAPKNAGPINSHRVVLGSLALMRDISPDYLNRFMAYVDTLLSLEQRGREAHAAAKMPVDGAKKAPSRRTVVSPHPRPAPRGR